MNKNFITAVILAAASLGSVTAQESLTNKNGVAILPVAGDIGLGFNAIPVINFALNAANIMNNNGYMAVHPGFVKHLGDNVIFGRYMLTDKTAARAHFRIGRESETLRNYVTNDTQNDPDSLVLDEMKHSASEVTLGGGYEFRRGKGRIQGIYGADVFVMFGRSKSSFEYGNEFGLSNSAPTSTDFNYGSVANGFASMAQAERITGTRGGNSLGLGVRPFVGVEYFAFSNVSIGAEFGWTISHTRVSEATSDFERFELASGNVLTTTSKVAKSSGTYIDTDTFNGGLFLTFYF